MALWVEQFVTPEPWAWEIFIIIRFIRFSCRLVPAFKPALTLSFSNFGLGFRPSSLPGAFLGVACSLQFALKNSHHSNRLFGTDLTSDPKD